MKRIVLLVIAALVLCFSANAQIVSGHYYDMHGSPYFRVDGMKELSVKSFGFNAAFGYYIPVLRSNFFYAPEIGLTGRFGNDKVGADDTNYTSRLGLGLKVVPVQFGYSLEISPDVSVNPRIGIGAAFIPIGSVNRHYGENVNKSSWGDVYESFTPMAVAGFDIVLRNSNMIISAVMEYDQVNPMLGLGLGLLF